MNGAENVDWIPAIAVLVAGLIGGLVVMFFSKNRREHLAREQDLDSVDDLEQRRDLLIVRLREMEEDATERAEIEREAAGVLRRIEELQRNSTDGVRPEPKAEPARSSRFGGFLWGVSTAVVIGLVIWFVAASATKRDEGASVTGGNEMSSGPEPQTPANLAALEQWVAQNPEDLEARLELASVYIMQQQMMKVWEQTQYVLQRSPNHPRATAYQAVVRLAMGQTAVAMEMLEKALAADPTLLDARIHLALAYLQMGRPQEAVQTLEEAKEIHPSQAGMIDELLREIMQQWPEVQLDG